MHWFHWVFAFWYLHENIYVYALKLSETGNKVTLQVSNMTIDSVTAILLNSTDLYSTLPPNPFLRAFNAKIVQTSVSASISNSHFSNFTGNIGYITQINVLQWVLLHHVFLAMRTVSQLPYSTGMAES